MCGKCQAHEPSRCKTAFTAQEEAASTHVPGRYRAKVVVCFVDDEPIEAVVKTIRLADEEELRPLFPVCEVGAMPPFGPLYGQTMFVDAVLAAQPAMVNPIVGKLAEPAIDFDLERVRAHF